MRRSKLFAIALFGAVLGLGCSGDGDNGNGTTGLQVSDLAGTWTATKWEYVQVGNPSVTEDVILLTFGATINVNADGSYQGSLTVPGVGTIPFAGAVTITNSASGSTLELGFSTLIPVGAPGCETTTPDTCQILLDPASPFDFDVTLSGNTLTLEGSNYSWDFLTDNPDGGSLTTNLTIVLLRS